MVQTKKKPSRKILIMAVVVALMIILPIIFSIGANAASYPVLTRAVDLRTRATIVTEGNTSVLIDNKGNKYTLTEDSEIYSGGGTLCVYINNTAPVTINGITCKGKFQVMGGTGTLDIYSSNDAAIDVGYFDVQDCDANMTIRAQGVHYGIRSNTFIEVAKGVVQATGFRYGTYAKSYHVIERGGTLIAGLSSRVADDNAAVYSGSYIEVRDSSKLDANALNGTYGVHAKTYLSVLRGSNVNASAGNYGIYVGYYFSILDNSSVKAVANSGTGMYAERQYLSVCRGSSVDASGSETGIRVGQYFSVLTGSTVKAQGNTGYGMYAEKEYLSVCTNSSVDAAGGNIGIRVGQYFSVIGSSTVNAKGCNGAGAWAEKLYVSVLSNSRMVGDGQTVGVYARTYMSVLSGAKLTGIGDIGLQADTYIHTGGVGSSILGEGKTVGVLAKGNGGDSLFATNGATLVGEAIAYDNSVGIQVYGKGRIAARSNAIMSGSGNRTGIETVDGQVEACGATVKGISYNINSGYSAITASKGVGAAAKGVIKEEYQGADIQLLVGSPLNVRADYAAIGRSISNLTNYGWTANWSTPLDGYVTVGADTFTAMQGFGQETLVGIRTGSTGGEAVSLASGCTHEVAISFFSAYSTFGAGSLELEEPEAESDISDSSLAVEDENAAGDEAQSEPVQEDAPVESLPEEQAPQGEAPAEPQQEEGVIPEEAITGEEGAGE